MSETMSVSYRFNLEVGLLFAIAIQPSKGELKMKRFEARNLYTGASKVIKESSERKYVNILL